MQINLPQIKPSQGFTLIELLVVIAIIAVLAVMGFAAYTGITGRGNDARRQADVKSYADAMEVKRGTNSVYQPLAATDFSAGVSPQDPGRSGIANSPKYCYTDGTAVIANPAAWNATDCPAAGSGNGTAWMVVNNATLPTVSATATYFKVCGMNDAKNAVICRGNRQ